MRKSLYTLTLLAFAFGGSTACATKGFVKNQVTQVSSKVDTLSQSLEETQERTKRNEAKITDVDGKAGAAQGAADHAQSSRTKPTRRPSPPATPPRLRPRAPTKLTRTPSAWSTPWC
jgi:TolA-binding protein